MDSGREVKFNTGQLPHLDYGYAVTSHSSRARLPTGCSFMWTRSRHTVELLNSRMAYVSVSRAQFDVQMYTTTRRHSGKN